MARLTYKQRLFLSYFLGESNGNATDAARRAGYREPNVAGPRLLVNASIKSGIEAKLEGPAITAKEVLARLSDHATATIEDFVKFDSRKRMTVRIDTERAKRRLHCIKKLKRGKYGWEIELYDAQAALEKLGKYHGLFDRMILDGEDEDTGQYAEGGAGGGEAQEPSPPGT